MEESPLITFDESRDNFLSACDNHASSLEAAGWQLQHEALSPCPDYPELTTDIALITPTGVALESCKNAATCFSSHGGGESYSNSAAMSRHDGLIPQLSEILGRPQGDEPMGKALVHGLNPYGMAKNQRGDSQVFDWNRAFLTSPEAQKLDSNYRALRTEAHQRVKDVLAFNLADLPTEEDFEAAAQQLLGFDDLREALFDLTVAPGQNQSRSLPFYASNQAEVEAQVPDPLNPKGYHIPKEAQYFRDFLEKRLPKQQSRIAFLDGHTGLPYAGEEASEDQRFSLSTWDPTKKIIGGSGDARLTNIINDPRLLESSDGNYQPDGEFYRLLETIGQEGRNMLYLMVEQGTYLPKDLHIVAKALFAQAWVAGNQPKITAAGRTDEYAKMYQRLMQQAFYIQNEEWLSHLTEGFVSRFKIINDGLRGRVHKVTGLVS